MLMVRANRQFDENTPCRVYRNLNRGTTERPVYSVQQYTAKGRKDGRKRWLVVAYATSIMLRGVTFKVDETKRQKVIAEQRKNVHAYAIGVRSGVVPLLDGGRVSYNPYKGSSFTFDGEPVDGLPYVRLAETVEGWGRPIVGGEPADDKR